MIILFIICILFGCSSSIEVNSINSCDSIIVYLEGEVIENQVQLPCNSNFGDLIDEVELTSEADVSAFSLTMPLYNEDHIYIPKQIDNAIHLNQATKEQLMTIKGIGEKTAERIIEYRNENGVFTSIDELLNIKGIGEKKLASIKEELRL